MTATAVVTGASSGIGRAAALALAGQGWRVIGVGRDAARCAAALAALRAAAAPGVEMEMVQADLSLLCEAARAADRIGSLTSHVSVLINNAGGVRRERLITAEGNEATFAANYLGPFLLTRRMLPLLGVAAGAAGQARIINVSSIGHHHCTGIDWNDLQRIRNFSTGGAYTNAKLAVVLFTRALSARLRADGIVVHAMEPGVVLESNFISHADETMQRYMATLTDVAISNDIAAETLVWLAAAAEPGMSTGGYFHRCQPAATSAQARDEAAAERLWVESEALLARVLG